MNGAMAYKRDSPYRNGPCFEHEVTTIGNVLAVTYTHDHDSPLAHLNRQGDDIVFLGITDSAHILGWTANWTLKTTVDLAAHHREVRRQRALDTERRVERRRLRSLRRTAAQELSRARQSYAQIFSEVNSISPAPELEPYDVVRARVLRGLRETGAGVEGVDADTVSDDSADEEEDVGADGDLPYVNTTRQGVWSTSPEQSKRVLSSSSGTQVPASISPATATVPEEPTAKPLKPLSLSLDALDELAAETGTHTGPRDEARSYPPASNNIHASTRGPPPANARAAAPAPFCLLCAAWVGGSTAVAVTAHGRVVEYEVRVHRTRDAAATVSSLSSPRADPGMGSPPRLFSPEPLIPAAASRPSPLDVLLPPPAISSTTAPLPSPSSSSSLASLASLSRELLLPQRPPPLLTVASVASRNAPFRPVSSAHLPHLFPHLARARPTLKPALVSPRRAPVYPFGSQPALPLQPYPPADTPSHRNAAAIAAGRAAISTSLAPTPSAPAAPRVPGLSPPPALPSIAVPYPLVPGLPAPRAPCFNALGVGAHAPAHASLVELPRLCCAVGGMLLVCAGASLHAYDPSRRMLAWSVDLLEHMSSSPTSSHTAPATALAAAAAVQEPPLNSKDVRSLARARVTALTGCATERGLVAIVGTANGCVLRVDVSREQQHRRSEPLVRLLHRALAIAPMQPVDLATVRAIPAYAALPTVPASHGSFAVVPATAPTQTKARARALKPAAASWDQLSGPTSPAHGAMAAARGAQEPLLMAPRGTPCIPTQTPLRGGSCGLVAAGVPNGWVYGEAFTAITGACLHVTQTVTVAQDHHGHKASVHPSLVLAICCGDGTLRLLTEEGGEHAIALPARSTGLLAHAPPMAGIALCATKAAMDRAGHARMALPRLHTLLMASSGGAADVLSPRSENSRFDWGSAHSGASTPVSAAGSRVHGSSLLWSADPWEGVCVAALDCEGRLSSWDAGRLRQMGETVGVTTSPAQLHVMRRAHVPALSEQDYARIDDKLVLVTSGGLSVLSIPPLDMVYAE